ncbi:hypothetical protein B296_00012339 [Ensete ventricosum]|uniref:Uncharacterized protein n=1 Tax=Ensete ventricosum TaxID=4639 RepID=A0A426ZN00_ENSVE|nr:hypothetical protein B296_00012339 [Ensete ventricosum]
MLGWPDDVDEDDAVVALHRVRERPPQSSLGLRAGVHHYHDPSAEQGFFLSSVSGLLPVPAVVELTGLWRRRRLRFGRRRSDPDARGHAAEAEARQPGAASAHRWLLAAGCWLLLEEEAEKVKGERRENYGAGEWYSFELVLVSVSPQKAMLPLLLFP